MKRYFLFAIGYPRMHKKITAIINPEILDFSKETNTDYEGCLSIPK